MVCPQVIHFVVALSVQDCLDLLEYFVVVVVVTASASSIYAVELPVAVLGDMAEVSLGGPALAQLLWDGELP